MKLNFIFSALCPVVGTVVAVVAITLGTVKVTAPAELNVVVDDKGGDNGDVTVTEDDETGAIVALVGSCDNSFTGIEITFVLLSAFIVNCKSLKQKRRL